jgi:hypothetical protein
MSAEERRDADAQLLATAERNRSSLDRDFEVYLIESLVNNTTFVRGELRWSNGKPITLLTPPLMVLQTNLKVSKAVYGKQQLYLKQLEIVDQARKQQQEKWFESLQSLERRIFVKVKEKSEIYKRCANQKRVKGFLNSKDSNTLYCGCTLNTIGVPIIDEETGIVLNEKDILSTFVRPNDIVVVQFCPYFYYCDGIMGVKMRLNEVYLLAQSEIKRGKKRKSSTNPKRMR